MDQSLAQRVHSKCALNVCMQIGARAVRLQCTSCMEMCARAVRLQCTSWTSMTAKSTHAHYVRMRIMKCVAQTFAIKIVQIKKYKKSRRFKKWLLICGTKPREGCSQCQVLPLILLITSPLTYGLPGTSYERSLTSPIKRPLSITRELGNM